MITTNRAVPSLLTALLLGFLATPTVAQTAHTHSAIPPEQIQKADVLLQKAADLEASCEIDDWKEAAKLLVESAALRPCHDPEIFPSLNRAARLYQGAGDMGRAEETMERAAMHALYTGDVNNAIEGFIALAWIAREQGNARGVHMYLVRAQDLSASPLLSEARVKEVHARINDHISGG